MPTFHELYDTFAVQSFDKQMTLAAKHGSRVEGFDRAGAELTLPGVEKPLPVQILGVEVEATNVWRWAWADPEGTWPPSSLEAAQALRAHGERDGVRELTTAEVPRDVLTGEAAALVASGLRNARAYHCAALPNEGVVWVLIPGSALTLPREVSLNRLLALFPQVIGACDLHDHRLAIRSYGQQCGFLVEEDPPVLRVRQPGVGSVVASFDDHNRTTQLEALPEEK